MNLSSFPVAKSARKSRKTRENPAPYLDIMQEQHRKSITTLKWWVLRTCEGRRIQKTEKFEMGFSNLGEKSWKLRV